MSATIVNATNQYNDIYVYLPSHNVIIFIAEGSGCNLLSEDIEQGYVDYIYYDVYDAHNFNPENFNEEEFEEDEIDGGMVMLNTLFQEQFSCTQDAVSAVLDMYCSNSQLDYILLGGDKNEQLY